jgi:hypothetical protein
MIDAQDVVLAYALGRGVPRETAEEEIDASAIATQLAELARGESASIDHERGMFVIQGLDDPEGGDALPMHVVFYADEDPPVEGAFVYVGHSGAFTPGRIELGVVFERALDRGERRAFEASVPPPLSAIGWGPRGVRLESDDELGVKELVYAEDGEELDYAAIEANVREAMVPSDDEWQAYEAILAAWLCRVHAVFPIALALKPPIRASSAWHARSIARLDERVIDGALGSEAGWALAVLEGAIRSGSSRS